MSGTTSEFTFPGANGQKLAGRLDLPRGPVHAHALFAHCFTCTKDIVAAARISRQLNRRGIGVLRFDFTGLGASEGEFANSNFSSNVDDLVAAADHMRSMGRPAQILIGHSLGGAAVLAGAQRIGDSVAVATIGAPSDPAHIFHVLGNAREEIERDGEAEVVLAGRSFRIQKQFLDDIEGHRMREAIGSLGRALLVMHSPLDEVVSIDNAAEIFVAARHPKSFVSLDDADHLLSDHADAQYAAEMIATWAQRYVGVSGAEEAMPAPGKGEVIVGETGAGAYANFVATGSGHAFFADEPENVGGDNSGPSPYDLLLAALGACKSMTMRMYAQRKGFDLERAQVRLSHGRVHAADCEECHSETGRVDVIETRIELSGNLSEEERQRIFQIAEKCPVHRTITGEVLIRARLEE